MEIQMYKYQKIQIQILFFQIQFDGALAVHNTSIYQVEEETKLKAPHLFASAHKPLKCTQRWEANSDKYKNKNK